MPWDSTNKVMTPPIDVRRDLAALFNVNSGDIGDIMLAGASQINRWAIYKPIRSGSAGMLERATFETLGFGSLPPNAQTVAAFVAKYTGSQNNDNGWTYLTPNGGTTQRFRLYDFLKVVLESGSLVLKNEAGYMHNASNPFGQFSAPARAFMAGGNYSASNTPLTPVGGWDAKNICIQDMNAMLSATYKLLYYGVLLDPVDTTMRPRLLFNTSPIGSTRGEGGSLSITLSSLMVSVGNYIAYPFFTPSLINNNGFYTPTSRTASLSWKLIPLPGSSPIALSIAEDDMTITIEATTSSTIDPDKMDVAYAFTIENNTESSKSVTYLFVKFRVVGKTYTDPIDQSAGEEQIAYMDTTIPALGSERIPSGTMFQLEQVSKDAYIMWVGFRVGTKNYYKSVELPVPITPTI